MEENKNIQFYPHPPQWVVSLVSALLLILIIFIGALTRNALREHSFIGRTVEQIYTITIDGQGKVTAIPDIAQISLGIETQRSQVAAAQQENTSKMNKLIIQLKELDIDEVDIKTTNYNIYPRYNYNEGTRILQGYVVSQNVTVKVRDLDSVGVVLELAGQSGVNQLGGLSFTIDEPEDLRQEAREKALENAREKAEALAKVAGVKLGRLVSFNEGGGAIPPPIFREYATLEVGIGGGAAPDVQPGSQDIEISVSVTYEVL